MVDLSHWHFAQYFSGPQIAALILGVEPSNSKADLPRIQVVQDRLALDYRRAVERAFEELSPFGDGLPARPDDLLVSEELSELWAIADGQSTNNYEAWYFDEIKSAFFNQRFSRTAVAAWLEAIGMPSEYHFDRNQRSISEMEGEDLFDPSDFPEELSIANIAFRAVKNGHGDSSATFRNRLIDYLGKVYPDLKDEAVDRIATVANPDKSRGRKKLSSQ